MGWLTTWQESAARRELAVLGDKLTAALGTAEPGVRAALDQHAAAIRDILTLTTGRPGPIELAGYARGVRDAAVDLGWRLRTGAAPDWVSLRLLAACRLAHDDHRAGDLASLPAL